ncbi:DUF1146 family protein [Paenisporosarcina sp. FSL H8-0542]|uniref:DUF1146 family protein n=1 Tax=unclassified Paenisporosarcina TaxID=2642018 RepID=UPI00034E0338|nr:DUF1146 family protein [Paenisporosarcina sp. HGH0030]EPD51629.1 hypothetical protein HMPREF1210_01741 [Paenisporosarcina sp. HGH0030]
MYTQIGQQAILGILSHTFFIGITFFALRAVMIEKVVKKQHVFQVQLLYILLSIAIGSSVSNFFLHMSTWSKQIPFLFS